MNPQFLPPPEIAGAPQPLWAVVATLLMSAITTCLLLIISSILP